MIAAGVGCRGGCSPEDMLAALDAALAAAGLTRAALSKLCVPEEKAAEPGVMAAARALDTPLVLFSRAALLAQAPRALTDSPHARASFGVPSVAETAALAGAATLGVPRLLGPRQVAGAATCALAIADKEGSP